MKNIELNISYKNNIVHVEFPNQYELCSTMIRFQEYYESSYEEIKGKVFTLETYMDLYAKDKGNFTYFSDWDGFNVSGSSICSFLLDVEHSGGFLSKKEQRLFDILKVAMGGFEPEENDYFYLIATHKKNKKSIKHEYAHAYYNLYVDYKKSVTLLINKILEDNESSKFYNEIINKLSKMGYSDDVLDDEFQAYLSTSTYDEMCNIFNCNKTITMKIMKLFKGELNKFIKENYARK